MKKIIPYLSALLLFSAGCGGNPDQEAPPPQPRNWPTAPTGKRVEVIKTENGFRLYRNGAPYEVRGAAGAQQLEMVKKAGGNSVRVYETPGLDTLLDRCQELGLSVLVSFDLQKPLFFFDYRDEEAVRAQKEEVRHTVLAYKDHPALLAWGLGNEVLLKMKDPDACLPALEALEDMARMVRALDPDHPVTTAVSTALIEKNLILPHCPSLDFITVNSFDLSAESANNGVLRELLKEDRPFLLSEWGVRGWWQCKRTQWNAPIEQSDPEKVELLRDSYHNFILAQSRNCIGNFLFFWGHRQERTPTWFSLFSQAGEKTPLADLMYELWGGGSPLNRAPLLDSLRFETAQPTAVNFLEAGSILSASVQFHDPEGDSLSYFWEILEEGPVEDPKRRGIELRPPAVPGSVRRTRHNHATFQLPGEKGPFRLFVYARDGHGNIASANLPFYTTYNRLVGD